MAAKQCFIRYSNKVANAGGFQNGVLKPEEVDIKKLKNLFMKTDNVKLNKIQKAAFEEIRISLKNLFPIQSIILFGSFARGGGDPESDVDLLILTKKQINRSERHKITDLIFEINLKYGTNFSTLVLDKHSWENGIYSVLPIKEEILKEGVEL